MLTRIGFLVTLAAVLAGIGPQRSSAHAWYDNSANNKFNPNPDATVYYGDQTWEEMHFPSYGLVLSDPSIDPRRVIRNAGPGSR